MTDARLILLDVFTRAGVKVPEDLSLIGYDDSHLSDYPTIDLTRFARTPQEWRTTQCGWRSP